MSFARSFRCANCGHDVSLDAPGTSHRNHCPRCLWSRHVDVHPGDRAAGCGGLMEPLAVVVTGSGPEVVHRCARCESNSWQDDAGSLTLGEVLDLARVGN